jgi:hypothetical protein
MLQAGKVWGKCIEKGKRSVVEKGFMDLTVLHW